MTAIRKTTLQVTYFQGFTNLATDLWTSNDRFGLMQIRYKKLPISILENDYS